MKLTVVVQYRLVEDSDQWRSSGLDARLTVCGVIISESFLFISDPLKTDEYSNEETRAQQRYTCLAVVATPISVVSEDC